MKVKLIASVVAIGFFAVVSAFAATADPKPSILNPPPGPCAAAMVGPDYVPGADAAGNPVPPADLEAESPLPLPPEVVVPAGQSGAYVSLNRKTLHQLVTLAPCGH